MASRFSQLTPERIASVQSGLENGDLSDFADLCDRMIQRDADVLAGVESRLSVISGSTLIVELADLTGDPARDALREEAADLVRRALSRIPRLSQRTHESLMAIPIGAAVHEIEWGEDDLGALVPVNLHWLHLRRFRYSPEWVMRIVDTGFEYDPKGIELKPDHFLVHEPRAIPGYPTGGTLRPVMWLFLFKSWALQFWHSGAEQFAWPTAVGTVARASGADARATLQGALEAFSNGKSIVLDEGSTIDIVESTTKDGGVNAALVAACDRGIAKALLGMTDLTDPARVGSYSSVVERKGATVDARVLKDERALAASWEAGLVEPTMRLNEDYFGGVIPATPKLSWEIAVKRTPIPVEVMSVATTDEVRQSHGLVPFGGARGAALYGAPAASPAGSSEGTPVAAEALNGAQVIALVGILEKVFANTLPAATAREIILGAYSSISVESIDRMLATPPRVTPITEASPVAP